MYVGLFLFMLHSSMCGCVCARVCARVCALLHRCFTACIPACRGMSSSGSTANTGSLSLNSLCSVLGRSSSSRLDLNHFSPGDGGVNCTVTAATSQLSFLCSLQLVAITGSSLCRSVNVAAVKQHCNLQPTNKTNQHHSYRGHQPPPPLVHTTRSPSLLTASASISGSNSLE